MNPHKGRSAPKKKKKAVRKDNQMPFGTCYTNLPNYERIVDETAVIIDEDVFYIENRVSEYFTPYKVASMGYTDAFEWINEISEEQRLIVVNRIRTFMSNPNFLKLSVGIPWSVCVVPSYVGMTDFDGFGLVFVGVLSYVIVRPVYKIVEGLKSFMKWFKRVSDLSKVNISHLCNMIDTNDIDAPENLSYNIHGDEECWICLEPFHASRVFAMWESDYFCCGHLLCPKCTPSSPGLKSCGVCRAVPPPKNGLEERIMERVRNKNRRQDK
jgi:hypothetical protein